MTNCLESVERSCRLQIRAEIRTERLPVLDELAEDKTSLKSEGNVPDELRQHVQQAVQKVGDAQVHYEEIHSRELLSGSVPL